MPSFFPRRHFIVIRSTAINRISTKKPVRPTRASSLGLARLVSRLDARFWRRQGLERVARSRYLHFNLYIHTGWKIEIREIVDRLRIRIQDVDEPLVNPHLVLVACVLVNEC